MIRIEGGPKMRLIFRIYLWILLSFVFVKFWLRPFVLENSDSPILHIFVLSYPNFCEAVAGTILVNYLLKILFGYLEKKYSWSSPKEVFVALIASIVAGLYVLLQEFKIHNIGGENVYDPYDALFSVIGVVLAFFLLIAIRPKLTVHLT